MHKKAFRSSNIEYDYDPWSLREILSLGSIMLYLLFVPWAMGGIQRWAVVGTGIIGLIMLLVQFIPLRYINSNGSVNSRVSDNLKAFGKSPVFWGGFLFITYILIQAFNPAYKCLGWEDGFIMEPLEHIQWLPSGYIGQFHFTSPWRYLLFMCPAWICVSILCTQVSRKRIHFLIWFQIINICIFAIIALLQHQTKSPLILWHFPPYVRAHFWGTVINPNMAVAYLNLGLVLTAYLFLQEFRKQAAERLTGGPYLFLLPIYAVILGSVFMAYCRAGIVISLLITILFAVCMFIYVTFIMRDRVARVAIGILTMIVLIAGVSMASMVSIKSLETEWLKTKREASDLENNIRTALYDASAEMLKDDWITGRGAASYRFFFRDYQKDYPVLSYKKRLPNKKYKQQMRVVYYAHNDFQQYLIELGVIGMTFFLAPVFYFLFLFARNYKYLRIEHSFFLIAMPICLMHCSIDFVYSHPLGLSGIFFTFYSLSKLFQLRISKNA